MTDLAIVGAGSWGTALAIVLAPRFEAVRLWARRSEAAIRLAESRINEQYLPGVQLPRNVFPENNLETVVAGAPLVLLVVPSQHLRSVIRRALPHLQPGAMLVSAVKGLETGSLLRMSEVIVDETGINYRARVGVLSGPTFASEVAKGEPATAAVSSEDSDLANTVQSALSGPCFRLYTNADPVGVEIGAALKNVIAIGAGIVQGLGMGNNTKAALITRGLAEITRLALALGGRRETLAGLAGLGDLVLTCTGDLSRNRRVGIELAHGRTLTDIVSATSTVAEGIETTQAAVRLASRHGVEMPITEQMYAILRSGKAPREGIRELMDRSLKSE